MNIGRFLCRDEAERRRMIDLGRALRPGTPYLLTAFLIAGLSGVGTYGWAPLLPPLVAIAVYAVMWALNMPRRGRPEYAYAFAFVLAELMLALGIALASGPRAYALVILAMPVLFMAVLFPRRSVVAGSALGVVLMLAVLFGSDLAEVRAVLSVAYCAPLVLLTLALTALVVRDLDDASRRSAFVDDLTRALNRAALAPRLAELTHQAADTGRPVAAVVGDIDHFKAINDRHGHVVGDAVLCEVARRMSDCVSAFEPVYRLGGEEFLVLLPGLDTAAAHDVALRMWQAVRDRQFDGVSVTMSFGVAASTAGEPFDFDALFARADSALYAAKQGGRDRVRATADGALRDTLPPANVHPLMPRAAGARRAAPVERVPEPAPAVPPVEPVGWTQEPEATERRRRPVTEELEREHILDLNRRLGTLFRVIAVGAFVAIAGAIPSFGWHTLIAPVAAAIPYFLLSRNAHRFRRPGRALGTGWVMFQTSIAIGFICARGAPLFALSLLILMVPGRCAVLRARPAAAGTVYTAMLMTFVAFDLDASAILHNPAILLIPMALLIEAGYVGSVVGRSAVGFRGAGIVDELTGLLNRTALRARLLELDAQSATVPHRVALLLADVDHFKQINDRRGHAAGDAVLREVGERIRGCLRSFESAYRIGGEEILVLLSDTDADAATLVAEHMSEALRSAPCDGVPATISVGVAVTEPGVRFDYREVFERADAALYDAKRHGRDRVWVDGMTDSAAVSAA